MSDDWDNLRAVLHVVRAGSLGAAAQVLGVNYTTVSRRIAAAERSLGARLFDRRQSGYVPTAAGQEAARHAERMEAEEIAMRRALSGRDDRLAGPLTITASELLIAIHLCRVIDRFLTDHPQVELTVRSTNEVLDLTNHEADLAVRISADPGDTLVGRRLTGQHTASFASADLAARMAAEPARRIDWIGFTYWKSPPVASLKRYGNARIRLQFDDMNAVVGATQAGLGVARMPMFLGRATPGLVQVPMLPPQRYHDIWALSHRDLKDAAKVRAFRDALVQYFKENAAAFSA